MAQTSNKLLSLAFLFFMNVLTNFTSKISTDSRLEFETSMDFLRLKADAIKGMLS